MFQFNFFISNGFVYFISLSLCKSRFSQVIAVANRVAPRSKTDPGSRIHRIQDLVSWWILDPTFQVLPWDPGILDPTCSFCPKILMDPGPCFITLPRDPGILDPAFSIFGGTWGSWILHFCLVKGSWRSWILMFCFSMGFRGSSVLNFWHCMGSWISSFGRCTSLS